MIYGTIVEIDDNKIQSVMKNILPFLYLSMVIGIFNIGCKTTEQQPVSELVQTETKAPSQVQPIKINLPKLNFPKESNQQLEKQSDSGEDSLFARIERTPCYGRCQTYRINIYKSGYVIYEGIRFVNKLGTYSTRINDRKIQSIINKANEIGYFDLEDVYDSPVTDLPSTYTYLSVDGKKKTIKNRVRGPEKLREFEKYIDSVFEDMEWKKIEDKKQ